MEEVELLEANQSFNHVCFPSGQKSLASTSDLAPNPRQNATKLQPRPSPLHQPHNLLFNKILSIILIAIFQTFLLLLIVNNLKSVWTLLNSKHLLILTYLNVQPELQNFFLDMAIIIVYSQSCQTPLTDCFTLTGSSEGNLKQHTTLQNYFYIINVPQKLNYSYSKTMSFN